MSQTVTRARIGLAAMLLVVAAADGLSQAAAKPEAEPSAAAHPAYAGRILPHILPGRMAPNTTAMIRVTVENESNRNWQSLPPPGIALSYHWLGTQGKILVWDGIRTGFPVEVRPGQKKAMFLAVQPPSEPGRYVLQVTLVEDGVAWFENKGFVSVSMPVEVR